MTTRFLIRIVVAAFLTAAALPLAAWEYDRCTGNSITWAGNARGFRAGTGSFPAGPKRTALMGAMNAWNIAPGRPFLFSLSEPDWPPMFGNFENDIYFSSEGFDGYLALTRTYHNCWYLYEADIKFNLNYNWVYDLNPTQLPQYEPYSFPLVAIHELGHAIGLQHPTYTLAMMAPTYPSGGVVGQGSTQHFQPLADDVQGARAGYGTRDSVARDLVVSAYATFNENETGLTVPASHAYRGRTTGFGFSVGNRGTTAETVQVNFYFSTDRLIDTSDTYLGTTTVSLDPGANPKAPVQVTLPMNFPLGTYYFGYIVDPSNAIAETDELNNAVAMAYPTQVPNYTPPQPCFTFDPPWGVAPVRVNFNATCSSDVDGYITDYEWDFGDGSTDSGATTSHVYGAPGTYTVTLTVTDNQGHARETTSDVLVVNSSGCIICE